MNKRISIIATTIALAVALAPAAAFADEAVSFNGEALGTDANKANAQTVYFDGSDWRVIGYGDSGIASADGTATLLAADVMGSTYFNDGDNRNNHYAGSLLQGKVNGIANAIPAGEVAAIVPRTLAVSRYDDLNTSGVAGEQVEGAILWPLSTAEADSLDGSLASLGTEYSDYGKWWWLRSPGGLEEIVAVVNADGFVDYYGHNAFLEQYGVRPAFNLNLTSVLFSSAAEGGKFGGIADGNFSALSGTSFVSAWKLTLLDSSRSVSVYAPSDAVTVSAGYSSWTIPVTFSGGATNANDYVSAILCKADGTPIYYGTVANAKAEGTQDMAMPTGLEAGSYTLKVFSEQRNGDKATDYAGDFVEITLTVEAAPKPKLTITANDQTYVYNGQIQGPGDMVYADRAEIAEAVTVEGLEDGDSLASIVLDGQGQDIGTYPLTPSGVSIVDSNGTTVTDKYDIDYVDGMLTIYREYEIAFVNWDGAELQSGMVAEGEMPAYEGEEPTRPATAQYTYTFKGWDPEISEVTGNATYTATYTETAKKATLSFDLAGGTLDGKTGTITIEANVGETIKLPGAPTREGYTFKCWKGSEYQAGAEYTVPEGGHEFTAEWEKNDSGAPSDTKPAIPATGDNNGALVLMMSFAALGSLCVIAASVVRRRRDS